MRSAGERTFRLVVFDWDGTLSDSTSIIAEAIQSACRDMGESIPSDAAARFVIGLGLSDAIKTVAPGLPAHRHSELADHYRRHYLSREGEIPLFEGARELLDELHGGGYLLAVATGKSRIGLDRALAYHGLAARFHATRCADEGYPKPHPDMLLHLMRRLEVDTSRTLMIGDTTHDMELARNAGTKALAVSYGAHTLQGLAGTKPLSTVHSLAEMVAWLREHG